MLWSHSQWNYYIQVLGANVFRISACLKQHLSPNPGKKVETLCHHRNSAGRDFKTWSLHFRSMNGSTIRGPALLSTGLGAGLFVCLVLFSSSCWIPCIRDSACGTEVLASAKDTNFGLWNSELWNSGFDSVSSSAGTESSCNAGDPGLIPGSGEGIGYPLQYSLASLMAQLVKNPSAMRETWVWSLGWEDPLEKGTATHSSILAWRILWTV